MASPEQLVADARTYANSIQSQATNAVTAAVDAIYASGAYNFGIPNFVDATGFDIPELPDAPLVDRLFLTLPEEPTLNVTYQGISAIEVGLVPEFSTSAPVFSRPTAPNQLPDFNGVAPAVTTNFSFPEAPPELTAPSFAAPVMAEHLAPAQPTYTFPEFLAEAPGATPLAGDPAVEFYAAYREAAPSFAAMSDGYADAMIAKHCPQYHQQMARVEAQLTKYLDGGTGLKPEIEDAIYARGQAKNDVEAKRVQDSALADMAARGFTMPNGVGNSMMARARQEAANNNAKMVNEIAIAQAEMEQKNLQFAVSASASLRSTVLSASLNYMQHLAVMNGQALDYAKTALGAVIELYNMSLKRFGAQIDLFKAEASMFEVKLKGVTAKIDIYRSEISAMEALVGVDRAKVDIYKARIDALNSLAGVYRTRIDAVTSLAGLEKLKIDLFQAQVQTYSSQVQAKNSEWQGFTAAMEGQKAEAGLFSAQVQAYSAQVQGYKTKIDAQSEVVRAQIATNQASAEQAKTSASLYSTITQARSTAVNVQADLQKLELSTYSEQLRSEIARAQMRLDFYKANTTVATDVIRAKVSAAETNSRSATAKMQAIAGVNTTGIGILGNMASAAMSGMNSLVALTETV